MPFLIIMAVIFEVISEFPYTSLLSVVGIIGWMTWSIQKRSRLEGLERQRYLDDVAAFRWHDGMDPLEFERRCA